MRPLSVLKPTPEQLRLILSAKPGIRIVRGAAGSGKTTHAMLMLRMALGYLLSEKKRSKRDTPIRAVVFTFNRTLAAYITAFVNDVVVAAGGSEADVDVTVTTLSKYALNRLPKINPSNVINDGDQASWVVRAALKAGIKLDPSFLAGEVQYLLGRFPADSLADYVKADRTGRGAAPRVDEKLRLQILNDVIAPYVSYKKSTRRLDWNDVALMLCEEEPESIDILIADETQDFSANQLRAVIRQLAQPSYAAFVLDTAQRIYSRGFTWREVGLEIRPENVVTLGRNYRNSKEIAVFAAQLLHGTRLDEDGTLPSSTEATANGRLPVVLEGRYSAQVTQALAYIDAEVDLATETVGFLHAKGGGWFDYLRGALEGAGLDFAELTRVNEWPPGDEAIALSTIHSVKGLEFDHVFMLGLSDECFSHGQEDEDEEYLRARRLVAMGITRARKTVTIGYKADNRPKLVELMKQGTFTLKKV
ncbi:3'-5' exonuclease [Paraburkholderia sp. SOS3]|uniref:3'-5' exonuclease n=1 Tax=Paraburkholderia sp. SOS3 TaxID=1926494 RepID=UPI0009475033|nr:3'-5' exonuclease [Paraburkholderia sp. SOS3]APR34329.1 hypothetical protein BTO02_01700 [Paraburkholderia sp. SOS3]